MSELIDLTGRKVGRLTVLGREGTYQRPSGNKEPTWRCKCDCGNEVVVLSSNLKKKNTLSCGCLQVENRYGAKRETTYDIRDGIAYAKTYDGTEFFVNACDADSIINHRWHRDGNGYITDEHGNKLHRVLMQPPESLDVHHINGNKLDNKRSNLLMLTRSEHTALHNKPLIANGVTVQKHGRWELHGNDDDISASFFCSLCDYNIDEDEFLDRWSHIRYCPNCGAKMDGEA